MPQPRYYDLESAMGLIDEPNQTICKRLYEENRELIRKAQGSRANHQAWEGGYIDHITETMNLAICCYGVLSVARSLPFSLSDSLLALSLHDIEKPWKQAGKVEGLEIGGVKKRSAIKDFRNELIKKYGFELTDEHRNAIEYAEGEIDEYSPTQRMQGPLAAFVHACDVLSARMWPEHPTADPWNGAVRSSLVKKS